MNAHEAVLVNKYVEMLRNKRGGTISSEEIGVISPYRKQVQKLRKLLEAKGSGGVKVGSTEEFQGQERKVIIISAVRSDPQFVEFDALHRLGFLGNPKRFNVAITRAKALLIIIGNPKVLRQDKHWNELLQYCLANKAYTGSPSAQELEDSGSDDDNVAAALANLDNADNDSDNDDNDENPGSLNRRMANVSLSDSKSSSNAAHDSWNDNETDEDAAAYKEDEEDDSDLTDSTDYGSVRSPGYQPAASEVKDGVSNSRQRQPNNRQRQQQSGFSSSEEGVDQEHDGVLVKRSKKTEQEDPAWRGAL
jgi:hypothetical protein